MDFNLNSFSPMKITLTFTSIPAQLDTSQITLPGADTEFTKSTVGRKIAIFGNW